MIFGETMRDESVYERSAVNAWRNCSIAPARSFVCSSLLDDSARVA